MSRGSVFGAKIAHDAGATALMTRVAIAYLCAQTHVIPDVNWGLESQFA